MKVLLAIILIAGAGAVVWYAFKMDSDGVVTPVQPPTRQVEKTPLPPRAVSRPTTADLNVSSPDIPDEPFITRDAVEKAKKYAVGRLAERSAKYRQSVEERDRLKAKLDGLTPGLVADEIILNVRQQYLAEKAQVEAWEKEAIATDDGVKAAIAAEERRVQEMIDAARQRTIRIPVQADDFGMLPEFHVQRVVNGRQMIVVMDRGQELLVQDVPTAGMKEGQSGNVDMPIKVVGSTYYRVGLGPQKKVLVGVPYRPK